MRISDWSSDVCSSDLRAFRMAPGLVGDGRDMGTVVFPDAPLKIFLVADVQARAERRCKQLKEKGISANLLGLLQDMRARDERDRSRANAPLVAAPDAKTVDSSNLSIDATAGIVPDYWSSLGLQERAGHADYSVVTSVRNYFLLPWG